uniref:Uncharacterized protein n=1 Tax=Spiroplasma kunkelii CR2-3x TaxID=273035 RepID=Q5VCB4_SPIKU|nr:hypothetical protein SKUN_p0080 [Spiroplasma kunkelii CR2-3x]
MFINYYNVCGNSGLLFPFLFVLLKRSDKKIFYPHICGKINTTK